MKIEMINTLGDIIRTWDEPDFAGTITLDTHNLPQGLYILQITDGINKVNRKLSIIN